MNILLPKTGKYNIGDDFPLISIPTDISEMNPVEKTFDDFQWWAESSEFKKWMDKNKRQWVADSEDMTKYADSLSDLIREHIGSYAFDNEINESDVLSFDEYDTINEAGEPLSDEAKVGIKFHYAYNKLKADGKLKSISSVEADLPAGAEKAVFLVMEDPDTKKSIDETLKAYKMIGLPGASESKIKIVSVKETLPGGPLDPDTTTSTLIQGVLKSAGEYAAIGVGVGVTWAILRKVGYTVAGVSALKALRGLAPVAKAGTEVAKTSGTLAKSAAFLKKISSGGINKVKVLGNGLFNLVKFKNSAVVGKSIVRGIRGASKAAVLGKSSIPGIMTAFKTGLKRGVTKGGARLIPFVGEVLLAVDAIGSTWNWFSDNQAPKWTEIEDTIAPGKGGREFNPGKIKDGTAITICWKQPAGTGLGIATSFLYSNDTRTTAELFKIGKSKDGGSSIFILTSVNSKEYQQALLNYAAVIVEIKDKDINAQGGLNQLVRLVDNEDMDVKVAYLDKPEDMASNFNFKGICDWSTAQEYYDAASDQYLISDNDAPESYEYYYKTSKNDYVNVSGNLLTNEEIGSKSDSDIQDMFANADTKINNTKPEPKEEKRKPLPGDGGPAKKEDAKFKEKEQEGGTSDTQIADSENNRELWLTPMVNESAKTGMVIRKFAEFEDVLEYVVTSGKYPEYSSLNEKTSNDDNLVLDAEQASEPAKIAVYAVSDIVYADPADRQYTVAAFKYFMIDPVDFDAPVDSLIGVGINTNETMVDPRRGVYEFKEKKEREEKEERKPSPEENPEQDDSGSSNTPDSNDDNDDENEPNKDDYFITADPDDISIKNRKNATVIRDKNFKGGINIVDEFLTDKEKEILGIPTWKAVTLAKSFLNGQGEVIKVKLKNRYAPMFNKAKTYEVQDGEAFQIAKKFAAEVEDRIKFQ
jgi:hypothetical protein